MVNEKPVRQEFADTMLEVGKKDSRLAVLVGDISYFILQPFAKECPGRFYNIGICEPTMVNIAAGLARVGFIPVVHTIAPFLIERTFEQIKLGFGEQQLGGNLISVGSGFDYGTHGPTHHCYDDFALMKNIEGSQVVYPASCKEFNKLFKSIYFNGTPNYFRIPADQHGIDFKEEQIEFGKGILAREGKHVTIIVSGPQLKTAMNSVNALKNKNIDPEIIYIHTIKPFDREIVNRSLAKTKCGLVIEEHSQYGGIFEDVLRSSKDIAGVEYSSINLEDRFVRGYGSYEEQCKKLGFSIENIVNKIEREFL